FFQAEDGIRDLIVTGVQTCALPISRRPLGAVAGLARAEETPAVSGVRERFAEVNGVRLHYRIAGTGSPVVLLHGYTQTGHMWHRSEERSVGKGCDYVRFHRGTTLHV